MNREARTIDWFIKAAEARPQTKNLTPTQRITFKGMVSIMEEIKRDMKRINSYGGVESLIAKASLATQNESLFPPTEQ